MFRLTTRADALTDKTGDMTLSRWKANRLLLAVPLKFDTTLTVRLFPFLSGIVSTSIKGRLPNNGNNVFKS